jgi:hypothetical protein
VGVGRRLRLIRLRDFRVRFLVFWSARVTLIAFSPSLGSEAAFVICLFSVYPADLGFLLERRRLDVTISRARTLCIVVSSDEVLCPSVKIFANAEAAKG